MATFEAQVNGITNLGATLTGSTNPTDVELDQFLKDGVIDVTHRCIAAKPQEVSNFQRKSESDSQGVEMGRGKIISVLREANADGSTDGSTAWRECRKVLISMQSRVVDTDSLHFASIYNPVYTVDDTGVVNVYPTPSGDNGIEVYYVNNAPVNGDGNSLVHSHDDIKYFPADKIYLVVIYAAIKSLESKMAEYLIDEEDIELIQGITANIGTLKQQYENAFASMVPPSQRQPQQATAGAI